MRRISMAGSDVAVTDDRVAELVLEYAKELGRVGTTDTITVPVADSGIPEEASLLLGPASQIAVTANDQLHLEQVDLPLIDEVVADLRGRIAALTGADHPLEGDHDADAQVPDPGAAFPDFDAYRADGERGAS